MTLISQVVISLLRHLEGKPACFSEPAKVFKNLTSTLAIINMVFILKYKETTKNYKRYEKKSARKKEKIATNESDE